MEARALEGDRLVTRSGFLTLDGHPAIHRGSGTLDVERRILRKFVQPVENLLVLLGSNHLLDHRPTSGYQEKDRPLDCAYFLDERHHFGQDVHVMFGNCGIDLDTQADIVSTVQDVHRPLPGAGHLAERIMDLKPGCVQRQGDAPDACFSDLLQPFFGRQGGGGGSQRAAQAFLRGVSDQLVQVTAHHRVAAGED